MMKNGNFKRTASQDGEQIDEEDEQNLTSFARPNYSNQRTPGKLTVKTQINIYPTASKAERDDFDYDDTVVPNYNRANSVRKTGRTSSFLSKFTK